jgi:hypothetical protein
MTHPQTPRGNPFKTFPFWEPRQTFFAIVITITDTQSAACNNFKRADVSAPKGADYRASETQVFQRSLSANFDNSNIRTDAPPDGSQSLESARKIV